jgi:hypothetical protein
LTRGTVQGYPRHLGRLRVSAIALSGGTGAVRSRSTKEWNELRGSEEAAVDPRKAFGLISGEDQL